MITCLIWLIVWCIVAVIVVYAVETLLGLWMTLPPAVFVLIRLLAGLLVVLGVLSCLGMLPAWHPPAMR